MINNLHVVSHIKKGDDMEVATPLGDLKTLRSKADGIRESELTTLEMVGQLRELRESALDEFGEDEVNRVLRESKEAHNRT